MAGDLKNIAEQTKKVENVTGFFMGKLSGKQDMKDVLSVVSVSLYFYTFVIMVLKRASSCIVSIPDYILP